MLSGRLIDLKKFGKKPDLNSIRLFSFKEDTTS
jgi:hypothetical protein